MTPKRRQICRPLARGSKSAFVRRCLKDGSFKKAITKGICTSLRREIALLTSDDVTSILRSKSSKTLNEFTWDSLLAEVRTVAPTLLSILQGCCKTRKLRKNQDAIVGVLVAILCKHRRSTASLVQRLTSLILYSGHASKKVYSCLYGLISLNIVIQVIIIIMTSRYLLASRRLDYAFHIEQLSS